MSYGVLLVSSEPRSEVKAEGSDCEDAPGNAVDVIFAPEVYANPCLSNILRLYLTYFWSFLKLMKLNSIQGGPEGEDSKGNQSENEEEDGGKTAESILRDFNYRLHCMIMETARNLKVTWMVVRMF